MDATGVALAQHANFYCIGWLNPGSDKALRKHDSFNLIGFYLAGALGGVLRSEDNALLMGALLLFAALGTTMLATRHVNWHRLSSNPEEA